MMLVCKKDHELEYNNYGLLSQLPNLSAVIEKSIHLRLTFSGKQQKTILIAVCIWSKWKNTETTNYTR